MTAAPDPDGPPALTPSQRVRLSSAEGALRGGALQRTRTALLAATERCLLRDGLRRTTMAQVAREAGVAKATLYNHVRTKDELVGALLQQRLSELGERARAVAAQRGLAAALAEVATALAGPVPRRLVEQEPELLGRLVPAGREPGWQGPVWAAARTGAADVLRAAGADEGAADLLVRGLLAQVLWPPPDLAAEVARLSQAAAGSAGTASAPEPAPAATPAPPAHRVAAASGLGWPA